MKYTFINIHDNDIVVSITANNEQLAWDKLEQGAIEIKDWILMKP
jgi:hypothetical protein